MWQAIQTTKRMHPLNQIHDIIYERGVVVLDNVTSLPFMGEPFLSPNLIVAICHRGCLKAEYDTRQIEFKAREASVIFPNHTLHAKEISDDYLATLVVVSPEAFKRMTQRSTYQYQMAYQREPGFPLTDKQYAHLLEVISVIRFASQLDIVKRVHILANMLDVISLLFDAFRFPNDDTKDETPQLGEELFSQYYNLIARHHHETREVAFYAKKFNLSPKYFSTLIKRETGVAAGNWISNYIIIQAKSMLRNRMDLNIQQIGLKLGFTDQAAFSRYFRTNTGGSPRSYRNEWS